MLQQGDVVLLIVTLLLCAAAYRYGDRMLWKHVYPTVLFVICVDFSIGILTYSHSLWHFHKTILAHNHVQADFYIAFIHLPLISWLYLSYYPEKVPFVWKCLYCLLWTAIFGFIEAVFSWTNHITYHHGWHYGWSVAVWLALFIAIRLHMKAPVLAWLMYVSGVIFLLLYFHIPIMQMK